ncbi:MAG: hypothetical protein SCALA701_35070 [Candidatus Scalindua sp.]|nr:EF-hand domain-containing protein [Planctomycetota bacterium]GJQ60706.1 MAG: hypothetical protein SCALA701_35070 [Candidatus Scalindua sp.]
MKKIVFWLLFCMLASVPAFAGYKTPQEMFYSLDVNKDGKIMKEELMVLYRDKIVLEEKYVILDKDGDGSIVMEEFVNVYEVAKRPKAEYEVPRNRLVSEVLNWDVIEGEHYTIEQTVRIYDGFMHHFAVNSDFGTFEVTGDSALRKLLREIDAIAALQEVKKSKIFMKAVKESAKRPFHMGKNMITHPVDTVSGVGKGVGTLFGNIKKGISGTVHHTTDPSEDSKAEQVLQMTTYKREWAYKLGVDPYSSNKSLQKELNSIGWAGALGGLTMSAVTLPASATAGVVYKTMRLADTMDEAADEQRATYVDQINKMVEELPPSRMRITNEEKLAEIGIDDELAKQYLDSPYFTPRHDAIIVNNLASLKDAKGCELFLQMALCAMCEDDANFFQNMVEILHGYNSKVSPITELNKVSFLLVASAKNGNVMIPIPVDHGIWRAPIDRASQELVELYPNSNIEFWVTGTVSTFARQQVRERGMEVKEQVGSMISFMD